jgi:hypothetical protein
MDFFDCNVFLGRPIQGALAPAGTVNDLLEEMQRDGISQCLVWHFSQYEAAPPFGNRLLAELIQPHPQLTGCWTLLPAQTKELPPPQQLFDEMRTARILALRAFPRSHQYLLDRLSLGTYLDAMVACRVPLFLSVRRGCEWQDVYAILEAYPELVCVICDHGPWGMDRFFRPLFERYRHVYVDTAQYMLDGGIEGIVKDYGAERLLFGSGFPESYFGGIMLMLRHARINQQAKSAIASENLARILTEVHI